MNKFFVLIFLILSVSQAQAAKGEAGVIVGSATGLSLLFDIGSNRALDFGIGYNVNSNSSFNFHGDYLITNARRFDVQNSITPLTMYYGLGGRIVNLRHGSNNGKTSVGLRGPIGLHYMIYNPDISFFGELALALDVVPEMQVEFLAGIGVRIRF